MNAVYRDERHGVVRAIGVDAVSTCSRAGWQGQYQSSFLDGMVPRGEVVQLSAPDRLLQDSMTRALIHRVLPEEQWLALVAMYSQDGREQVAAVQKLATLVGTNAGPLFKRWCVGCWALPALRREAKQVRDLDQDGTPDRTLRDWRKKIQAQLNDWRTQAFAHLTRVMSDAGLVEEAKQ